jgi:cytochrome c2
VEGTVEARHAALYRAHYSDSGLGECERIFRASEDRGGLGTVTSRMLFLADKTLLVAVTEDHKVRAQELGSHFGKILRINRDGSIPGDNPFVNTAGARPEIWSYGHRVPMGLYQDPEKGTIFEVEAGPRGGDEMNVLKAGANYGWAKASWGFDYYNGGAAAPLQTGPGIEDPILVWMPSVTPSGLTRYRGNLYPLWDGDFFLGHLTTKELERLKIESRRVVLQERMLLDLDERIRDVKVGPDDHVYVLTDHADGRLLRLQPGTPRTDQLARVARKIEPTRVSLEGEQKELYLESGDPKKGRQAFLERCVACHGIGTTLRGGAVGPDLTGVYGHLIGHRADFDYSPNMSGSPIPWSAEALDEFLAGPSAFAPGTKMTAPPVTDPEIRREIIGFLKQQSAL